MQLGRSFAPLCLLLSAAVVQAAPRVELEISLEPGFVSTEMPAWHELLSSVGVDNLRLGGGANAANKIGVERLERGAEPTLRVLGVISARHELLLPGGRFTRTDRAGLGKWLTNLKTAGPPRKPGEKPLPFGLDAETLDAIAKDLAKPVDFNTAGIAPTQVLVEMSRRTANPIVAEPAVNQQLARAEKVPGELKGLSCGTAAAAILRREGLAIVPRLRTDGRTEYFVTRAGANQDVWPIGWPPEKPVPEILPGLFTLRNVEIDDIPASQLLQVIADRLKLPMLFDEQSLVLKNLDPSKVKVKIPLAKIGYETVLDRAMYQAGMKHEVRVDDAGKPFLWVTAR